MQPNHVHNAKFPIITALTAFACFSVRSRGNCGNIMMYLQALTYAFISQGASCAFGNQGKEC
nr:MAG TPA_asm: hypothetical protein [Caudoviricetes sp.]